MSHLVLTFICLLSAAQPAEARLPTSLDLETIRALPVQHDGRWPPLETVARDIVESVTGSAFHKGHDPAQLLLAWTFEPEIWRRQPLIAIRNAELRTELQLPPEQTGFSYAELNGHQPYLTLVDELLRTASGRKLDPLESKVGDIRKKLLTLRRVFSGRIIRPIPDGDSIVGAWRPIPPNIPEHTHDNPVSLAWTSLRDAFRADDAQAFAAASDQLIRALSALPAVYRPDSALIATELRYNKLRPFHTGWMVMVVAAVLAAAAPAIRRKWFDFLTLVVLLASFAILTYGLSLRWQIAGRIPAANMFESLLFLSWGASAFAILSMLVPRGWIRPARRRAATCCLAVPGCVGVRDGTPVDSAGEAPAATWRLVPLTAAAMAALALILADCLPLDQYIRPIMPVLLDTIWMSIHVPIIMVAYAVLAVAVVIAHVQLILMSAAPRRRALAEAIDNLHYWYVHIGSLLLLAGIITGSMWAASSWGRYWGWDPKEVWSLVAFLGYLAILHVRIDREKVPAWAYVVAILLVMGVFVLVVSRLAPLTPLKVLAFAGTGVAMGIFVLARGRFATALKSILAFWLIIMTYVGVNYVLGTGLHSYGFGTGAVVRYLYLIAGIDFVLIAVCCAVYATIARSNR